MLIDCINNTLVSDTVNSVLILCIGIVTPTIFLRNWIAAKSIYESYTCRSGHRERNNLPRTLLGACVAVVGTIVYELLRVDCHEACIEAEVEVESITCAESVERFYYTVCNTSRQCFALMSFSAKLYREIAERHVRTSIICSLRMLHHTATA